jgi:hypothetical protein
MAGVTLVEVFRARLWWAVLVATLAGGLVAASISLLLPRSYRAEATLALTGPEASRELQLTFVEILTSPDYLRFAAEGSPMDGAELSRGLRAIPSPGTLIIAVVATSTSRDRAILRANLAAERFGDYLAASGIGGTTAGIALVRSATGARQTAPLAANTVAGAMAGLLCAAAVGAAVARRPGGTAPGETEDQLIGATDEHKVADSA